MKIILVEDNLVQQDLIEMYVQDCGHEIIATYASAEEAKKGISEYKPQLILMDINLEGQKSGVDLAIEIKAQWTIPIIFITSQTELSVLEKVVKNSPIDILIKPIKLEQLKASLMLAEAKLNPNLKSTESPKFIIKDNHLIYKNGHLFERTLLADLLFIEGMGNYFSLCYKNEKVTLKGTLTEIEAALPQDQFARVNRSVIVSLSRIKSFNQKRIFMENGKEFPLSKKVSESLLNRLMG